MEGFKNAETKREDIKEALKTGFEVAPEEVAFVYFNKGESDAKLRFGAGLATHAITISLFLGIFLFDAQMKGYLRLKTSFTELAS